MTERMFLSLPLSLENWLDIIVHTVPGFWNDNRHYQHFTNHGPQHSERVRLKLAQLATELPETHRLSADEIFIVSAAAWLYEIGMQSPNLRPVLDFEYHPGNPLSFSECQQIRANKHLLTQRMIIDSIRQNHQNHPVELGLSRLPEGYTYLIAEVCRWCCDEPLGNVPETLPVDGMPIRLRLLVALLRFADQLYIDSSRVNLDLLEQANLPIGELAKWWMYHYTQTLPIKNGEVRFHYFIPSYQKQYLGHIRVLIEPNFEYEHNDNIRYLWDHYALRLIRGRQPTFQFDQSGGFQREMSEELTRFLQREVTPIQSDLSAMAEADNDLQQLCLDAAVPDQVYQERAFDMAVKVRWPFSPKLNEDDLSHVLSRDIQVDWPENEYYIHLRVQVSASECRINGEDSRPLRLYRGQDSPVLYFQLIPKKLGKISIIVRVHQEKDELGSTRLHTIVREQVVGSVQIVIWSFAFSSRDSTQCLLFLDYENLITQLGQEGYTFTLNEISCLVVDLLKEASKKPTVMVDALAIGHWERSDLAGVAEMLKGRIYELITVKEQENIPDRFKITLTERLQSATPPHQIILVAPHEELASTVSALNDEKYSITAWINDLPETNIYQAVAKAPQLLRDVLQLPKASKINSSELKTLQEACVLKLDDEIFKRHQKKIFLYELQNLLKEGTFLTNQTDWLQLWLINQGVLTIENVNQQPVIGLNEEHTLVTRVHDMRRVIIEALQELSPDDEGVPQDKLINKLRASLYFEDEATILNFLGLLKEAGLVYLDACPSLPNEPLWRLNPVHRVVITLNPGCYLLQFVLALDQTLVREGYSFIPKRFLSKYLSLHFEISTLEIIYDLALSKELVRVRITEEKGRLKEYVMLAEEHPQIVEMFRNRNALLKILTHSSARDGKTQEALWQQLRQITGFTLNRQEFEQLLALLKNESIVIITELDHNPEQNVIRLNFESMLTQRLLGRMNFYGLVYNLRRMRATSPDKKKPSRELIDKLSKFVTHHNDNEAQWTLDYATTIKLVSEENGQVFLNRHSFVSRLDEREKSVGKALAQLVKKLARTRSGDWVPRFVILQEMSRDTLFGYDRGEYDYWIDQAIYRLRLLEKNWVEVNGRQQVVVRLLNDVSIYAGSIEAENVQTQGGTSEMTTPLEWPVSLVRYSKVSFPSHTQIHHPAALRVAIPLKPTFKDAESMDLQSPPDFTGLKVDVCLVVSPVDFDMQGSNVQTIGVQKVTDSALIIFKVIPKSTGLKKLTVEFFQDARYLGHAEVETIVEENRQVVGTVSARPMLALRSQQSAPDLTIYIEEVVLDKSRRLYRFLLLSPHPDLNLNFAEAGEIELKGEPAGYFAGIFAELNDWLRQRGVNESEFFGRLNSLGSSLYEQLFPDKLKRLYWEKLRDKVKTIQIISADPWIPWELIRPYHPETLDEDDFLCERFDLTRWLAGPASPDTLNFQRMALIVDASKHSSRAKEAADLKLLPGIAAEDITPTLQAIYTLLESRGFNSLHFACHGEYEAKNPDQSALWFEGRQPLRPNDIVGKKCTFGREGPLVFLNACETGQSGISLTGMGGWARAFVKAGAAGFLGSLWEAQDESAYHFAIAFYGYLLDGKTIAEAVRLARKDIRKAGDPTWLSYTVYANPLARAELK